MLLSAFVGRSYIMRRILPEQFCVSPGFCVMISLYLLILPLNWVVGWCVAVLAHELSHYTALKLCGIHVNMVILTFTGAEIRSEPLNPMQDLICTLAGPVGGLVPVLLGQHMPYAAICSLLLSCYNLLPVYPLDGGRGLSCLLQILCGMDAGKRIAKIVEIVSIILLVLIAINLTIYFNSVIFLAVISVSIGIRCCLLKYPCKENGQIVQ